MMLATVMLAALATFAEVEKQPCDKVILVIGTGWEKSSASCRRAFEKAAAECADTNVCWCVYDRPVGLGREEASPLGRLPFEPYAYPAWIYADGANRALRHREGVGADEIARLPQAVEKLSALRQKRDAALKAAESLSGTAKANAVGEALAPILDPIINHYSEGATEGYRRAHDAFLKKIQEADPEDKAGWYAKYDFRYSTFAERNLCENWRKGAAKDNEPVLDRALANPRLLPIQRQYLMLLRARNYIEENRMPEALAEFDAVTAFAPKTTLASAAQNAKRYYSEPITLTDGRWHKNANRPYWATATMDVSGDVASAGTYAVTFRATEGRTDFRNARIIAGGKVVAEDNREGTSFELKVPAPVTGARLQVEMKGTGWFGGYGTIEVRRN